MTTINPQIDAAVAQMKARAAEFDETKTMEGVTALPLVRRAYHNIRKLDVEAARRDLLDAMNLCALALSVLPKEKE